MIDKAIYKIESAAASCDDPMTKMLGQQIIDNITSDKVGSKILAENKSLAGCKKAFDEYASKNKKGNQSVIGPQKAEELIFEYFEIKKDDFNSKVFGVINILDFVR